MLLFVKIESLYSESGVSRNHQDPRSYFLSNDWDSNILPYLQAQGTVTAVQLQTDAPVVTASGQQVQTLQVVVSPPACVGVTRVSSFACSGQGCLFFYFFIFIFTPISVPFSPPFLAEHVLQLLKLHAPQNTVWCCAWNLDFCFWRWLSSELSSSELYLMMMMMMMAAIGNMQSVLFVLQKNQHGFILITGCPVSSSSCVSVLLQNAPSAFSHPFWLSTHLWMQDASCCLFQFWMQVSVIQVSCVIVCFYSSL